MRQSLAHPLSRDADAHETGQIVEPSRNKRLQSACCSGASSAWREPARAIAAVAQALGAAPNVRRECAPDTSWAWSSIEENPLPGGINRAQCLLKSSNSRGPPRVGMVNPL